MEVTMDVCCVNKIPQENGDHEVHKSNCPFMPGQHHRLFLGYFNSYHNAVKEAIKTYNP